MSVAAPSLRELSYGLYGAWRLARLDPASMYWFDRTPEGVKRSFWAAVIAYPVFILMLALHVSHKSWASSGILHIVTVETIGYVFDWTAFSLAALLFCRLLGHEQEGFDFLTAYNWSQLLQTGLFFLVAVLGKIHLLPSGLRDTLPYAALILAFAYEWNIARIAIGVGAAAATTIVLFDYVLGEAVNRVTEALY